MKSDQYRIFHNLMSLFVWEVGLERLKSYSPIIRLVFDTFFFLLIGVFGFVIIINIVSKAQIVVPLQKDELPGMLLFNGKEDPCLSCPDYIYRMDGDTREISPLGTYSHTWARIRPSPDGYHLAWWSEPAIYVGDIHGNEPMQIAERGHSFEWSPDGSRLAYKENDSIFIVNPDGTDRQEIPTPGGKHFGSEFAESLSWSPDGTRITFRTDDILYVTQVADGQLTQLISLVNSRDEPLWSPAEESIAFVDDGAIFLVNALNSQTQKVALEGVDPVWSPNGRRLAFRGNNQLNILNLDTQKINSFKPKSLVNYEANVGSEGISWSPDGRFLAFGSFYRENQDADWKTIISLIDTEQGILFPEEIGPLDNIYEPDLEWSPDGLYFAFINGIGSKSIWVVDIVSRKPARLLMDNLYLGGMTDIAWIPVKDESLIPNKYTLNKFH